MDHDLYANRVEAGRWKYALSRDRRTKNLHARGVDMRNRLQLEREANSRCDGSESAR